MAPGLVVPQGSDLVPPPLPGIYNKDLLATLHLLVALAKCFQPDLSLPPNVKVEVIITEVKLRVPEDACLLAEHLGAVSPHPVWGPAARGGG